MRAFCRFWIQAMLDGWGWGWTVMGIVGGVAWLALPVINTMDKIYPTHAHLWAWAKFDTIWWIPTAVLTVPMVCYLFWAPYKYNRELLKRHEEALKKLRGEKEVDSAPNLEARTRALHACMDALKGKKNPNVLHTVMMAKVDELSANEDVLYIAEKIRVAKLTDCEIWRDILEYVPPNKVLSFLQKLRVSAVDSGNPTAVGVFLREIIPEL